MTGQICMFKNFERSEKRDFIKERIENYGVQSLMNWEMVSFLTGVKLDNLSKFKSFEELKDKLPMLEITELQKQKLSAIFEVSLRIVKETRGTRQAIRSPQDVADLMMPEMRTLKQEEFRIILLNTKSEVIEIKTISVGTLNASLVHPRDVIREAVLFSAASIVCVHQHPSGNPRESAEDVSLTQRLCEAGKLMGIEVVDHIIIGDGRFVSLKERNLI